MTKPGRDTLGALRQRIAAIEQGPGRAWRQRAPLTLGVPRVDRMLPGGGLARGALHEVLDGTRQGDARQGGAALAFAAVLAARRLALAGNQGGADGGRVLWCPTRRGLYGPGLAAFGLGAGQLILVYGRDDQQRLWAMEEGLKCTGLAMVVGEVGRLDLAQSRRLQLAAEATGVTALLLPARGGDGLGASAALTRWRITPAPSAPTVGYAGIGAPRLRAELLRCKGGRPGDWLLQWTGAGFAECGQAGILDERHEHEQEGGADGTKTGSLPVAAAMADGPSVPGLAARA